MTATVNLSPLAKQRFVDNNGVPLAGGKLFTYAVGSTTKQASYTDSTGGTPNANPVILDSRGEASIWFDQTLAYKVVLAPATDTDPPTNPIWTIDGVPAANVSLTNFTTTLAGANGAASVGFQQSYTGSQLRTQAAKDADTVSILEFTGIDPTGVADSTTAAQAFITACRAQGGDSRIGLWRKGIYKISSGLTLGSNQTIVFEPGVTINFTGDVNTSLFNSSNQSGNYLYGNGAVLNGNRAGVTLSNSGNQNAFYIYGSDNILIQDFNIVGFAMDGITITGDNAASGPCTNVRVVGVDSYNNGRNGMSIIHAIGVLVDGGRYWSSNGTPSGPWAGIDVEPNANEVAQGIVICGVRTQNNVGAGLQFTPGAMSSSAGLTFDVTVIGGRSTSDSTANGVAALLFTSGGTYANEVFGQVVVRDFIVDSPASSGVGFKNWDASLAPRAILENVTVLNVNGAAGSTGNVNQTAFVIYCDSTQAITNLGKITLRNCKAQDNRASPKMVWGGVVSADTGKTVQDVVIQDFTAVNYTSASKFPFNTDVGNNGSLSDVVVRYTNAKPVTVTASVTSPGWGGQRLLGNGTALTFLMPSVAKCKGLSYELGAIAASAGGLGVTRAGTDVFKQPGVAAATTFTAAAGDTYRFTSDGVSTWSVVPVN